MLPVVDPAPLTLRPETLPLAEAERERFAALRWVKECGGRAEMGEKVIINIKTFLDGHAPPDRVHPAMF